MEQSCILRYITTRSKSSLFYLQTTFSSHIELESIFCGNFFGRDHHQTKFQSKSTFQSRYVLTDTSNPPTPTPPPQQLRNVLKKNVAAGENWMRCHLVLPFRSLNPPPPRTPSPILPTKQTTHKLTITRPLFSPTVNIRIDWTSSNNQQRTEQQIGIFPLV